MVAGNFANRVRQVLSRRDNSDLEIVAKDVAGAVQAFRVSNDEDIASVINDALDEAGQDGLVTVENGRYLKSNNNAVSTKITSSNEGQKIDFQGSDIELADSSGITSMIEIGHDSFEILNVNLLGNRSNNGTLNSVITNSTAIVEPTLIDVEVSGAPDGILLDDITKGQIQNSGTTEENQDVDNALKIVNSDDTNITNAKIVGFNNDGIILEDSTAITLTALGIVPESGLGATNGVHLLGVRDSTITGTINADGELDKGVLDEAFDVGGANERFPTANIFDIVISGVNDIGYHIIDGEKERVRGLVDGSKTTGRTTQGFLVESPNGLAEPQHDINLSGITLTRMTDTDLTGQNIGMRVTGHFSKISNTATYGAAGNSTSEFTFGQSTPNPVLNVKSGTHIIYQETTNKTTTDNNGQVDLDWSDAYHFVDKPIITVNLEQAGQWHIDSYGTDGSGRFTDATVQVTDSSGTAVGNGVETNVKIVGV